VGFNFRSEPDKLCEGRGEWVLVIMKVYWLSSPKFQKLAFRFEEGVVGEEVHGDVLAVRVETLDALVLLAEVLEGLALEVQLHLQLDTVLDQRVPVRLEQVSPISLLLLACLFDV
jgi:hypothetical protein